MVFSQVDEVVEVGVEVQGAGLVDEFAAVGEGEGGCGAAASVGVAAGGDAQQGAGVGACQQAGDQLLAVLGEAGQQLEVALDGLSARLAQDPGQHRVCGQELRQLAPSDEPVGEVEKSLGRCIAGQFAPVASPGEFQYQRPGRQPDQAQSQPVEELLRQYSVLSRGSQVSAGGGQ